MPHSWYLNQYSHILHSHFGLPSLHYKIDIESFDQHLPVPALLISCNVRYRGIFGQIYRHYLFSKSHQIQQDQQIKNTISTASYILPSILRLWCWDPKCTEILIIADSYTALESENITMRKNKDVKVIYFGCLSTSKICVQLLLSTTIKYSFFNLIYCFYLFFSIFHMISTMYNCFSLKKKTKQWDKHNWILIW